MTHWGHWPADSAPLCFVVRRPLWTVIDRMILKDEPTTLAGRFDTIRVNGSATLRTGRAELRSSGNILVERLLVDISQCHGSGGESTFSVVAPRSVVGDNQ